MSTSAAGAGRPATRTGILQALALATAALAPLAAPAATNTVDFVTRINQCNGVQIDKQGNNEDLQLQAGTTRFELWADFIEGVNSITVHKDDNDAGTVEATIGTRRNGFQNTARGCPGKGSVEITVATSKGITANLRRELILKKSGDANDFHQGINVKAVPQFDLTFANPTFSGPTLPACLNLGTPTFLENNKKLEMHLPVGAQTDQSNCSGNLDLFIKIPSPQPTVDVEDDYKYTLTPLVTQQSLARPISAGGLQLGFTFVGMLNPPSFFTVSTVNSQDLDTSGFVSQQVVRLVLNISEFRKLDKRTQLKLTMKAPNDKASDVLLDVFPGPNCGFASGAASPTTVDTGNLVDITSILTANAPSCAPKITFKVTTASCFSQGSGGPLPTTRGIAGVGVLTTPSGAGAAPGFNVVNMRATGTAAECVGNGTPPTTASQRVDLFIGDFAADATVLDIPLGPKHIQVPLAIRKLTP